MSSQFRQESLQLPTNQGPQRFLLRRGTLPREAGASELFLPKCPRPEDCARSTPRLLSPFLVAVSVSQHTPQTRPTAAIREPVEKPPKCKAGSRLLGRSCP